MKRVFAFLVAISCVCLAVGCSSDDSNGGSAGGDSCHDGCVATVAAKCSNGPTDQASCESDCNALLSGACGAQFKAVQSCAVGKIISCDASGNPKIAGCDSQQAAFLACIN